MEQLVIVFGIGIAISFAVVLLALVLRAALVNSRTPAKIVNPTEVIQEPLSYDGSKLAHAIRGYDTPELFCEDSIARQQQNNEEFLN